MRAFTREPAKGGVSLWSLPAKIVSVLTHDFSTFVRKSLTL